MNCYTPSTSFRNGMAGGLFVSTDGSRHVMPDQCLLQAELLNDATLLRFRYTFGVIEVSGQSLESIFDDALADRLGAVNASSGDVPFTGLWVTNIVFQSLESVRISSSEQGSSDA